MAKELYTRISLKYDTYANWSKVETEGEGGRLVLLPGELGICEISSADQNSNVVPTVLFKVGGAKYTEADVTALAAVNRTVIAGNLKEFRDLPWASAMAADVYSWAKASDVTFDENTKTLAFVGTDKQFTFKYLTSEEVTAKITAITNPLSQTIGQVSSKVDTLNGDVNKEGSVAKAVADAAATTLQSAKDYADQAELDAVATAKGYTDDEVGKDRTRIKALEDANLDQRLGVAEGAIEGLVGADTALANRIAKVETFFNEKGKEEGYDGLDKALDTLVEIQAYLQGEGEAAKSLLDKINDNAKDIDELEKEFATGGRVTLAETAIDVAEGNIQSLQNVVKGYTGEGSIKNAIDGVGIIAQQGVDDALAANNAAKNAQDAVDALARIVNNETTGLAAVKAKADQNEREIGIIKGDYLKAADDYYFNCGSSTEVVHAIPAKPQN